MATVGGIDTSMYNTGPARPVNPLEMMSTAAGTANTLAQNRIIQGEYQLQQQRQQQMEMETRKQKALQKANQLMADHLNPDQTIDMNGLIATVAKDPDAVLAMPELLKMREERNAPTQAGIDPNTKAPIYRSAQAVGSQFNQSQQPGNALRPPQPPRPSQEQINDWHDHFEDMQGTLKSLIDKPDLSMSDIIGAGGDLVQKNIISKGKRGVPAAEVASLMSAPDFPREGPTGKEPDSASLRKFLQNHFDQITSTQAGLTQAYGARVTPQTATEPEAPAKPVVLSTDNNPNPTTTMAPPPGFVENQQTRFKHYTEVQNAANSIPQENAVLHNILNISKSGAPTGTKIGQIYQALASTGLAPKGVTDIGTQLKLIKSHAAQLATAGGMPGSDARLEALENAKISDKDLPQVIQQMIPYLLAVNNGRLKQAAYYRRVAGNGMEPEQVAQAQENWNQNYDPRILEMQELTSDPAQLKEYISKLPPEDKKSLNDRYKKMRELKLLGE